MDLSNLLPLISNLAPWAGTIVAAVLALIAYFFGRRAGGEKAREDQAETDAAQLRHHQKFRSQILEAGEHTKEAIEAGANKAAEDRSPDAVRTLIERVRNK